MTDLTSFTIPVGGAQLSATRAGDGPAVVFLHAGVADKRMWAAQQAALSDRYLTVAYDRRGFGRTVTADEPFTKAGDLRAVLDALGSETAVLVGCSQGGLVALTFALAHPERVSGLVLIAPAVSGAPPVDDDFPPPIAERLAALDAAEDAGDIDRVNELEAVLWLDGPGSPAGRVGGTARALFLDMNGIALRHPELTQEGEAAAVYPRLSEITAPTLLLWGDRDFAPLIARSQELVRRIPGARGVELPGAAHLPNLEQPEQVNALVRAFLDGLAL
jgi:pimeloyl-ACP methyl ester carboxylesterase